MMKPHVNHAARANLNAQHHVSQSVLPLATQTLAAAQNQQLLMMKQHALHAALANQNVQHHANRNVLPLAKQTHAALLNLKQHAAAKIAHAIHADAHQQNVMQDVVATSLSQKKTRDQKIHDVAATNLSLKHLKMKLCHQKTNVVVVKTVISVNNLQQSAPTNVMLVEQHTLKNITPKKMLNV